MHVFKSLNGFGISLRIGLGIERQRLNLQGACTWQVAAKSAKAAKRVSWMDGRQLGSRRRTR